MSRQTILVELAEPAHRQPPLDWTTATSDRTGSDFFNLNLRVSRTFKVGSDSVEGMLEAFNLANRRNNLTRIGHFGSGAYPMTPAATFNQITAVGDPKTFQLAARLKF